MSISAAVSEVSKPVTNVRQSVFSVQAAPASTITQDLTFEEGCEENTAFSSTPGSGAVVLPLIIGLRAPKSKLPLPPPLPLQLLSVQSAFPPLWKVVSILYYLRKEAH